MNDGGDDLTAYDVVQAEGVAARRKGDEDAMDRTNSRILSQSDHNDRYWVHYHFR